MTAVSDDNFGFWNLKEPEEQAFFDHVQSQSLLTTCGRCERPVRLMPTKTLCASCISALESGAPASISEYLPTGLLFRVRRHLQFFSLPLRPSREGVDGVARPEKPG
jgi:hypothetical protein